MEGTITEALPNHQFIIQLKDMDQTVTGYASGKIMQNKIRLTEGDLVTVEVSTYDLKRGRITFRHK